jgi:hypothetical protein
VTRYFKISIAWDKTILPESGIWCITLDAGMPVCLAGTKARCIALSQIGAISQEKKHPLQGPRGGGLDTSP